MESQDEKTYEHRLRDMDLFSLEFLRVLMIPTGMKTGETFVHYMEQKWMGSRMKPQKKRSRLEAGLLNLACVHEARPLKTPLNNNPGK